MAKRKLTFYFDILSPFAYLAYYMTRHSPIFHPVEITYIPIILGGLMKACGNRPPLDVKNKDKWIKAERLRWARQFKIPTTTTVPPVFPISTLQTQRALCVLEQSHPGLLTTATDALFDAFWVKADSTIGRPERIAEILSATVGRDIADDIMGRIAAPEIKGRLAANTDRAFAAGAFGIPWWECENSRGEQESFWGFDHLGQVVRFLELDAQVEEEAKRSGGMRYML